MSDIIYRGTLTKKKLTELANEHLSSKESEDNKYNPSKNPEVICITRQPDGNYLGETMKNGTLITTRQAEPNAVVTALITHG